MTPLGRPDLTDRLPLAERLAATFLRSPHPVKAKCAILRRMGGAAPLHAWPACAARRPVVSACEAIIAADPDRHGNAGRRIFHF